ncbi:hypothetical protein M0R45_002239 [Rubus argutus]|uniref:Uncharacterized protein n=1 Tax=Rubus argutus TaxID=59490 RepID=A0AAW1VJQ1_RUBAR
MIADAVFSRSPPRRSVLTCVADTITAPCPSRYPNPAILARATCAGALFSADFDVTISLPGLYPVLCSAKNSDYHDADQSALPLLNHPCSPATFCRASL